MVVLRIDNSNSQKPKNPLLIYNYGFIKIKYWIYNHSSPPKSIKLFLKSWNYYSEKKISSLMKTRHNGNLGGCSQLGTWVVIPNWILGGCSQLGTWVVVLNWNLGGWSQLGTWVVVPNWELGLLFWIGTWVVDPNWELGLIPIGLKFLSVVVFQGKKALWHCDLSVSNH